MFPNRMAHLSTPLKDFVIQISILSSLLEPGCCDQDLTPESPYKGMLTLCRDDSNLPSSPFLLVFPLLYSLEFARRARTKVRNRTHVFQYR